MMATDKERDFLAANVLPCVGVSAERLTDEEKEGVTGFLAMQGHLYKHDLMVVGRSVNGWNGAIVPQTLAQQKCSTDYAQKIFESVNGHGYCPMKWVAEGWGNRNDYNTRRSAFWRVIKAVVDELGIANVEKDPWPSYLVWSNLYKISPCEGGNPSGRLCDLQQSGCVDLLGLENSHYQPHYLLLLTGLNWAKPFLGKIATSYKEPVGDFKYVEAIGEIDHNSEINTRIVVACHPQGKPEADWVREAISAVR